MSYIFRLNIESSSGPQDVDADIQTFTAITEYYILALTGQKKKKKKKKKKKE